MSEAETFSDIIDATNQKKYPHTEKGKQKFLQDTYKMIVAEFPKFGRHSFGEVSRSINLFEEYYSKFELSREKGRIKISAVASENPCEEVRAPAVASLRKKVARREAFANLPDEKKEALMPIAQLLTGWRIEMIGQHSSASRIKALGKLILKLALKQIKECESFDPKILVKYRDAIENIQPGEKVADVIENARGDKTFGSISF